MAGVFSAGGGVGSAEGTAGAGVAAGVWTGGGVCPPGVDMAGGWLPPGVDVAGGVPGGLSTGAEVALCVVSGLGVAWGLGVVPVLLEPGRFPARFRSRRLMSD